ncbi:SDR family oxidoreductase [Caulobacter sp. S45]|uniref:SDR family oxidoreductase n=1 Tax=Caulobacter sp. S45 TaxID=1641861 RepID=UPI001575DD3F|nr:NAD-dependent epimerase/dehydratase family protein [Caulobacter sp. S45]
MRRILVLGATSLIGRRLIAAPAPPGSGFVALSRRPPAHGRGAPDEVRWIAADLGDPDLGRRLPEVDAVLSLSPIWLLPAALPALLATGAGRLVAVSSTSRLTKADSSVAGEREVAARLARGEDAVTAACDAAGVAWTILRPTLIYAEGEDRNVSRLAGLIDRFGVLPLAGRGEGLRQPVHAADLARAVLQALDAPAASGRIYALPGGETLSYRAMAVRIFQALGRPPRLLSLPPPLWRLGLALASPVLPGATAAMGARMSEDLAFDAGPAMRDFGYAPRPFRPAFPRALTSRR